MNQIDAYARRLRFWLPGKRGRIAAQNVREVFAEIIDSRGEQLGRPLNPEEIAAELRKFGPPQVVATRYSSMKPLVDSGLIPSDTDQNS